jgi:hypothetical protein
MKTIALFLALFLVVGFFARKYNGWIRLLLLLVIGAVLLYTTFL